MLGEDVKYNKIEDNKILNWLERQYSDIGFRNYFEKRDLTHLKKMGIGLSRDDYLIATGQRLELLSLLQSIDKANKTRNIKVERKLSSNNKKAEK